MSQLNIMDEYIEMYEEYYEEFEEIIKGGNCDCCPYFILDTCALQCER